MATTKDYGLGEFTFPRGWFMVAEAAELSDRPLAVRFFATDLVLFRGRASGKPALLDAYCPHKGAHLARNTTACVVRDGSHIEGDAIRCPNHGWRFRADGACDEIPGHSEPIPKEARVRSWSVHESLGIVWVWHDPEGLPPQWAAPEQSEWSDPAWVQWKIDHIGTLPIHGQEVVDNIADMAHFGPIHGMDVVDCYENQFDGYKAMQRMAGSHRTLTDAKDKLSTDATYHGPGFLLAYMTGFYSSILFIANTPVDDGVTRVWHGLLVKSPHPVARPEDVIAARAFQEASRVAFSQDFEVWTHKAPALKVLQVNNDGPFNLERIWYRQFFNPRARAAEFHKRVDGLHRFKGTTDWPATAPCSNSSGTQRSGTSTERAHLPGQ